MEENMGAREIIREILLLLKEENKEFDGNIYSFKYTNNIKNEEDIDKLKYNPCITLTGYSTIQKYNDLYKQLHKEIVANKPISLKVFMDTTQNLIFENSFTVENIRHLINNREEISVNDIRKIYGLSMEKDYVTYGKYTFIRNDYIYTYISSRVILQTDEFIDNYIEKNKNDGQLTNNFVYVLVNFKTLDNYHTKDVMDKDLKLLINFIRYAAFIKRDRCYVDSKPFISYRQDNIQYSDNGMLTADMEIKRKDLSIPIDDSFFCDTTNGNSVLWDIISSNSSTEFEKRLLEAINWVGASFDESDDNLIVAEIAFAFETLLFNTDKAFITKGITADLAEKYAFVNGISQKERITFEKEFKKFYESRSKISHGTRLVKKGELSIISYYRMIQQTIKNLLIKDDFKDCRNCEGLHVIIQKLRYK